MADFDQQLLNRLKGVSPTGGLFGRIHKLSGKSTTVLEPGDYAMTDDIDASISRLTGSPIAYDVWYLLPHRKNMINQGLLPADAVSDEYYGNQLGFVESALGVKPMAFCRDLDSFVYNDNDWLVHQGVPRWDVFSEWFIHMLAYELWHPKQGIQHESNGPDNQGDRSQFVGYIAFPVGQLGVMEVISIFQETVIRDDDFTLPGEEQAMTESTTDYFFSMANEYTGQNKCHGTHMIESAYLVPDDVKPNVEYLEVSHIDDESVYPDVRPMFWMRYWITRDEAFPVPGEFVGILVKPLGIPPHVWWYQRSNPFLYAGNWVETQCLTSGVVVSSLSMPDGSTEYTVTVHGRDITLKTSDYMEYAVGDRVGILKKDAVPEQPMDTSFRWADMRFISELDMIITTYVILPIQFYQGG